jgi:hypothetical protein
MDTSLVTTVVDVPMDFTVVANSPKEMEAAQRSLILWAARKIQAIKLELQEATKEYELCKEKKWRTDGWRAQILKSEHRMEFYRKIKMALEAGYYIVPPFPIDIFAIRTKRSFPERKEGTHPNNHDQTAQVLPAGDGRYVDPRPSRRAYESQVTQKDGTSRAVTRYYANAFNDVDFPFKLAKAEIREATDKALGLMVFDRLGVLPRTRSADPIVCGQIIIPDQPRYHRHDPKAVTFFVTWWLDTRTL